MNTIESKEIKSITGISSVYRRDTIHTLAKSTDRSIIYRRTKAREIFTNRPEIKTVEYVTTGNKSDSQFVGKRGVQTPPDGVLVYVASTGGKWGKSSVTFVAR